MATLKEHQAAMVDLLANGSGIPASASRLAHAMHDVLVTLNNPPFVRPVVECGEGGIPERPFFKRDVLHIIAEQLKEDVMQQSRDFAAEWGVKHVSRCTEAITPGLNDKALSRPQKALKTDSPAKWPTPAEQRVKELENTIKQLRAQRAKDKATIAEQKDLLAGYSLVAFPEQSGCRREDTQMCDHEWDGDFYGGYARGCRKCGVIE